MPVTGTMVIQPLWSALVGNVRKPLLPGFNTEDAASKTVLYVASLVTIKVGLVSSANTLYIYCVEPFDATVVETFSVEVVNFPVVRENEEYVFKPPIFAVVPDSPSKRMRPVRGARDTYMVISPSGA